MSDWLRECKKYILLTTGTILFGSTLYYKKKKIDQLKAQLTQVYTLEKIEDIQFDKDESYFEAINALSQICVFELRMPAISKQTLDSINRTVVHIVKCHYTKAANENRNNRMMLFGHFDLYRQECQKGIKILERLIEEATLEVLNSIGLDFDSYDKSIGQWTAEDPLFMIQVKLVFNSLAITKVPNIVVPSNDLKAIFEFKARELKRLVNVWTDINRNEKIKLFDCYINDLVENKFSKDNHTIVHSLATINDQKLINMANDYEKDLHEVIVGI